jgi:hypothetical protein
LWALDIERNGKFKIVTKENSVELLKTNQIPKAQNQVKIEDHCQSFVTKV